MIYEMKNRCLIKDNGERIELTELEHKFLIAISDEEITPAKLIAKYIFSYCGDRYIEKLKVLQRRLNKFIQVKRIEKLVGIKTSYILKTEIYFK